VAININGFRPSDGINRKCLSALLFNMVMDEMIKRVSEGQNNEIPNSVVYADNSGTWKQ
jgi:hypothetical protein